MAGISSKAATTSTANKNLYSSKELQSKEFTDASGLELYDFNARMQDPQLGRFCQIDPMSENYASLAPYNYVANNPINGIDPDGKDIIFLNDTKSAAGFGHAAVIIGNATDGWFYYSLNGTGEGQSAYGDSKNADVGTRLGHGSDINQLVKDANIVNPNEEHNYNRYVAIKTTPEEDRLMKIKAAEQSSVKKYVVIGSSCIDVCKAAYSSLAESRIGFAHGIIDKSALTMVEPNMWFNFFPSVTKRVNSYISIFGGDYLKPVPKRVGRVVVHPTETVQN